MISEEMLSIWGIKRNNDYFELYYNGKKLKFFYGNDPLGVLIRLIEQFIMQVYKPLRIQGRHVVDVGSYICDSSIFFAVNGAKHVYAFEPFKKAYDLGLKNVIVNGLSDKVSVYNVALYDSNCKVKIDGGTFSSYAELREVKEGIEVQALTIVDMLNLIKSKEIILKVDCEGCERFLLKYGEALRSFYQIFIEFDYRYKEIFKLLKNMGYKVKVFNKRRVNDRLTGNLLALRYYTEPPSCLL